MTDMKIISFFYLLRAHNLCLDYPISKLKYALSSSRVGLFDDVFRSEFSGLVKIHQNYQNQLAIALCFCFFLKRVVFSYLLRAHNLFSILK